MGKKLYRELFLGPWIERTKHLNRKLLRESFYGTGAVPERMGLVIRLAGNPQGVKDIVVAVVLSKQ